MINLAMIHGRITADPELRRIQSGKAVCGFCVAVDTGYGEKKQAQFIDCVAWEKTAEFLCKYFTKGQEIAVTGQLQTRTWEDKRGGKHKATELLARELDFCGKRDPDALPPGFYGPTKAKPLPPAYPDELYSDQDLPF